MSAVLARRAWVEQVMGLPVSVHVRGGAPAGSEVERAVGRLFTDLHHADAVFSPYREHSDLSRWERGEIPLGPELAEVLGLCETAWLVTSGWFDPRDLPDPRHTGRRRFDPSGLVKGWAVQRAARHLSRLPGVGWCINAGGDVLVHSQADQPAWRVGIEDPADPGRVARVIELREGAVATSGTTHRGAHIVDPRTGEAATGLRSATVVGPELLWADVYATAVVAAGDADWGLPSEYSVVDLF